MNHHGRSWGAGEGLFGSGLRVFVSVCVVCVWVGLVSKRGPLPAAWPALCLPSLPPGLVDFSQPRSLRVMPPTVDAAWSSAAFMPSARAFKHFPTAPLISITHGAPQAFRCHKKDFNPTAWQVSACPSSLTPVGGWLAQKLFSSAACGAGEQILAAWSGAQGSSYAHPPPHPILPGAVPLQVPEASLWRRDRAWRGLLAPLALWHGSGLTHGLGEASGLSCGTEGIPLAHP